MINYAQNRAQQILGKYKNLWWLIKLIKKIPVLRIFEDENGKNEFITS